MVQKNAVTKQNTSRPQAHLTATAEAFHTAVEQCVQDADSDAVHRVRTGSRRLQAMLEATLRESAGPALQQTAKAWLRPLKQIRRAAGEVRDLDVHRKLLESWASKESPIPEAASPNHLHEQAQVLDTWLKGERKHLAHGMQKQIRKRQQGLAEQQAAFLAAVGSVPPGGSRAARSTDAVALEDFVRTADAMPLLDAENLHEFRKATKKARYVAESGAEGPAESSVAKALKRIQDAIGEWHDWVCLREEAEAAVGNDAPDLMAFLERQVERHFVLAMKTTHTMRARLSGEWMAICKQPAKRPPATVGIDARPVASGF
ncbi:MAG: CHAD domain-containing protein [Acidobacteriaceae bacterium]|jgi:CHAD domain-containing protein